MLGDGGREHSKCPSAGHPDQTSGAMLDGGHLVILESFKGRREDIKEGPFSQESSRLKVAH